VAAESDFLSKLLFEREHRQMLREELAALHGGSRRVYWNGAEELAALHEQALKSRHAALCLSGGGIRSATFCLGVLQGLARYRLLGRFDYLSTVSGGGYIGGWLMAWVTRAGGIAPVEAELGGDAMPPPKPLRYLQANAQYLAATPGLPGTSPWPAAGMYLQKSFLNWLVLLPILALLVLVPQAFVRALASDSYFFALASGVGFWAFFYLNYRQFAGDDLMRDRTTLVMVYLAPLLGYVAGQAANWSAASRLEHSTASLIWMLHYNLPSWPLWLLLLAVSLAAQGGGCVAAFLVARRPALLLRSLPALGTAVAVEAGILYQLALVIPVPVGGVVFIDSPLGAHVLAGGILVGPLLLGVHVVTGTVYAGIQRRLNPEIRLEWWDTARSWVTSLAVLWVFLHALIVFGPLVFVRAPLAARVTVVIAVTVGAAVFAALVYSMSAEVMSRAKQPPLRSAARMAVLGVTGGLVAAALVVSTTVMVSLVTSAWQLSGWNADTWYAELAVALGVADTWYAELAVALAVLALGPLIIGFFIDPNDLSLHAGYRNALVRTFLGASWHRQPDPLLDLDPNDDIPVAKLARRPLLVANLARKKGHTAAGQSFRRYTESFTVSPLHAGNPTLGYCPSERYGGGITLGTVMAVSGAAVSPNLGEQPPPTVGLARSLLNARLGVWLENPRRHVSRNEGPERPLRHRPPHALLPLLTDALGRVSDKDSHVYLSDGGHFDNLGLYEMVRRRCRVIVVVDASYDPAGMQGDLANAIAKIRTDLNVAIHMDATPLRCAAMGVIRYPDAGPDAGPKLAQGTLLYLKPTLTGNEPIEVRTYAHANKDFPNETTLDQWFTEAQFEAYRLLGLHTVETVFGRATPGAPVTLDELVERVGAAHS
jgi:Patatin-like phospholipase